MGGPREETARLCTTHSAVNTVPTSCSVRTVVLRTVVLCLCVVHVSRARAVLRFALLHFASRTALGIHSFIHSFTCRHKATAPQATHVHMTVYVSCRAACAVVRVCTVRSLRVCACGVWAHFFAQGN